MATGEMGCSPWPRCVADGVIHPPHFSLNMVPSSMLVVVGVLLLLRMALLLIILLVLLLIIPHTLLLILIRLLLVLVFPLQKHGPLSLPSSEV